MVKGTPSPKLNEPEREPEAILKPGYVIYTT
jgi:hypothetical protein